MVSRGVGVTESVGVCVFVLRPGHGFLSPMWIFLSLFQAKLFI